MITTTKYFQPLDNFRRDIEKLPKLFGMAFLRTYRIFNLLMSFVSVEYKHKIFSCKTQLVGMRLNKFR